VTNSRTGPARFSTSRRIQGSPSFFFCPDNPPPPSPLPPRQFRHRVPHPSPHPCTRPQIHLLPNQHERRASARPLCAVNLGHLNLAPRPRQARFCASNFDPPDQRFSSSSMSEKGLGGKVAGGARPTMGPTSSRCQWKKKECRARESFEGCIISRCPPRVYRGLRISSSPRQPLALTFPRSLEPSPPAPGRETQNLPGRRSTRSSKNPTSSSLRLARPTSDREAKRPSNASDWYCIPMQAGVFLSSIRSRPFSQDRLWVL